MARPLKYLVPRIALADLPWMGGMAVVGAILAGLFGVVHDQVTYAIGPEYFTRLKFNQFRYADLGFGDRAFASTIGFLASWWVGFVIAWFLGRRLIPNQPRRAACVQILKGFAIVFACALLAGLLGYAYGHWRGPDADDPSWEPMLRRLQVTDAAAFVRVAYIHNASYLDGLVGLVAALVLVRPRGCAGTSVARFRQASPRAPEPG